MPLQQSTFESHLLQKNTGVTSCRCLKVIWSVLKASRCPLGSVTKASWSVQNGSKPVPESNKIWFSCNALLKNRFLSNMLPKHKLVTFSLVFRNTLRCFESLLKPGWTPEEGFLGAAEPNIRGPTGFQKSEISFRGVQQTLFMVYRLESTF